MPGFGANIAVTYTGECQCSCCSGSSTLNTTTSLNDGSGDEFETNTTELVMTTTVSDLPPFQPTAPIVAIVGGAICTTLLLLILLAIASIAVMTICRHKKQSLVAIDETQHEHTDIELDSNQAYITHSEAKHAGAMECIETDANQVYITTSEAQQEYCDAGTMDYTEVDANQAYITSTVLIEANVAYGTHPCEVDDYEYVIPSLLT